MIRIGLLLLMAYAAIGLVASIIVHFAATAGMRPGNSTLFAAFHIGIFPLWLPVVYVAWKLTKGIKEPSVWDFGWNNAYWKAILSGCPTWLKYMTYGFFAYAMVSFVFFVITAPTIRQPAGVAPSSAAWRNFSGHWMFFYCTGLAVLTTAYRRGPGELQARCPNGHAVGYTDGFCSTCGARLITRDMPH